MNKYRTHNCNQLTKINSGQNIILSGWVNKKRDHGNLLFIDLRDNYGMTQCIVDKSNKYFKELVLYLIKNGKRVGIASFGTYSIIKAYMERLFGLNKNPFHSRNMFASCQDIGCVRDYTNMPTNKNSFIRKRF